MTIRTATSNEEVKAEVDVSTNEGIAASLEEEAASMTEINTRAPIAW
jgi:hypothetical protein